MEKIRLKDLSQTATQWEHPCAALKNIFANFEEYDHNILNAPKKQREALAVAFVAMVLKKKTANDWWYYMLPDKYETPDGLVITLHPEKDGFKGSVREIEVVEHRDTDKSISERIEDKLKTSYSPDTVIVCLALVPGEYDFLTVSQNLANTTRISKEVFIVYHGTRLSQGEIAKEKDFFSVTLVQLAPKFAYESLDIREALDAFGKAYEKGQEARITKGNHIYYATSNPEFRSPQTIPDREGSN